MHNWLSTKEVQTLYDNTEQFRVKCKCGHTNTIKNKKGYKICSYCKEYVFLNPQIEFKFRLKQELLKEKRNIK